MNRYRRVKFGTDVEAIRFGRPYIAAYILKHDKLLLLSLVIDLANYSQVETAGHRVNTHQEVGVAARTLEFARLAG